jgi:hypothetical protein
MFTQEKFAIKVEKPDKSKSVLIQEYEILKKL